MAVLLVALADALTKAVAHTRLVFGPLPREIIGSTIRLTLVYNPGAAFGLHLGPHSRWIFMGLTVVALAVLYRLYRDTDSRDSIRTLAIGAVAGGAVGNLINRIWSARGVVDFIDVGIGNMRWPTFNLADVGVTVGALFLAWTLWREGRDGELGRTTAGIS